MAAAPTSSNQPQIVPWTIEAQAFLWRGQKMANDYWARDGGRSKAGLLVYI